MLVFVDESGHPHPKDPSPYSVLLAMCFEEHRSRDITRQLYALKKQLLGRPEVEIKAHQLLNERTFRRIPEKRELVESVVDLVEQMDGLTMFAIIMERPQQVPVSEPGILPRPHQFLLERVNAYLERRDLDQMGIVIYDSRDQATDRALSTSFRNFLFRSRRGMSLTRIVETPLFVNSDIAPGIELADLFASVVRQYHELSSAMQDRSSFYTSAIERFYRVAKSKTVDLPNLFTDGINYGFYKMPLRLLVTQQAEEVVSTEG
ncbi:MAG: DUF3800 domain-containing protein [Synergistales bacterium]|nr:DUF3800 domain-containing protein [Synergistales bacterium]